MIGPAYRYRAVCTRVIDADTLVLRVDLGFRCAVEFEGRLRGVNAPELSTDEGKLAREFVVAVLGDPSVRDPLVVESYRDKRTFARWVVDVWLPNGQSLGEVLEAAGHATRTV